MVGEAVLGAIAVYKPCLLRPAAFFHTSSNLFFSKTHSMVADVSFQKYATQQDMVCLSRSPKVLSSSDHVSGRYYKLQHPKYTTGSIYCLIIRLSSHMATVWCSGSLLAV